MCRKKFCICLIPELASAEYSQSAFFTIFASKSARMKYFLVFCLKKVFFTIVDLGKSKHSESFGPPFQKQNFFPRKASGVLLGPPTGPKEVGPMSTPSRLIQQVKIPLSNNFHAFPIKSRRQTTRPPTNQLTEPTWI